MLNILSRPQSLDFGWIFLEIRWEVRKNSIPDIQSNILLPKSKYSQLAKKFNHWSDRSISDQISHWPGYYNTQGGHIGSTPWWCVPCSCHTSSSSYHFILDQNQKSNTNLARFEYRAFLCQDLFKFVSIKWNSFMFDATFLQLLRFLAIFYIFMQFFAF